VTDFLRNLVLFCSDHDALKWKEIWSWRYSEVLEFSLQLIKRKEERREQIDSIEDPMTLMMTLLFQRLR
jgi:hypothetical protein